MQFNSLHRPSNSFRLDISDRVLILSSACFSECSITSSLFPFSSQTCSPLSLSSRFHKQLKILFLFSSFRPSSTYLSRQTGRVVTRSKACLRAERLRFKSRDHKLPDQYLWTKATINTLVSCSLNSVNQHKQLVSAGWEWVTLMPRSLTYAGEHLVAVCHPEIYLERYSTGLTPWNFDLVSSVSHSLLIYYPSPSTRSSTQLVFLILFLKHNFCIMPFVPMQNTPNVEIYADLNSSDSWVLISCQLHDALTIFLISSNC